MSGGSFSDARDEDSGEVRTLRDKVGDLQHLVTETELSLQEKNILSQELTERLRLITELASDVIALRGSTFTTGVLKTLVMLRDMSNVEQFTLEEVEAILTPPTDTAEEDKIIISCDASITKNPGGNTAVGFVIRFPAEDGLEVTKVGKHTPSSTNNEGEYDAVYEGLVYLFNHHNRPQHEVIVRSDSQIVVKQLLGEWKINTPALQRKCEAIHELVAAGPVPVQVEWHPRNSTPDLTEANFLAQDKLGVKRH